MYVKKIDVFKFQLMNFESGRVQSQGGSISNPAEAKFVADLAKEVHRQLIIRNDPVTKSIGILTFYNKQIWAIRKHLRGTDLYENVRSVDGYQV